jgi:hypothetical protein
MTNDLRNTGVGKKSRLTEQRRYAGQHGSRRGPDHDVRSTFANKGVFQETLQSLSPGHSWLNAQKLGRVTDFNNVGLQQVLGFPQRTFWGTATNGHRHVEVGRDPAVIKATPQDAAVRVDNTILTTRPLVATTQSFAFRQLNDLMSYSQRFDSHAHLRLGSRSANRTSSHSLVGPPN